MGSTKSVTVNLPEPLLGQLRLYAAERNRSIESLMVEAVEGLLDRGDDAAGAKRRLIERMRGSRYRVEGEVVGWKRDELYRQCDC